MLLVVLKVAHGKAGINFTWKYYTIKVDQYLVLFPLAEDLAPRVFTISHRNMRAPIVLTYFVLDGLLYRNIHSCL